MSGERDLVRLLAGLSPALDPEPYVFAEAPGVVPAGMSPLASFREAEGVSLIVAQAAWAATKLPASSPQARLTMTIQSSLDAVGMTAAIATALADAGIAANVVAALRHDHVFVPWERRHDALAVIEGLARAAARG